VDAIFCTILSIAIYFVVLVAFCTEDEIVYSLRATGYLFVAIFITFITFGTLDALVKAIYARL
jgi:hypothetical protein